MTEWKTYRRGAGKPPGGALLEYRLSGDASIYLGRAGELNWDGVDGQGGVARYREIYPQAEPPVGDLASSAKGSAARFNASKPDLSLIPAGIIADATAYAARCTSMPRQDVRWARVLELLGDFQMRAAPLGDQPLLEALYELNNDGRMWADCARVFEYGKAKYAAWNWAKGQAWSIPLGCALRHIVFGTLNGQDLDAESGLPHRGHIACNIVMLLWFIGHYSEGCDLYSPPVTAA